MSDQKCHEHAGPDGPDGPDGLDSPDGPDGPDSSDGPDGPDSSDGTESSDKWTFDGSVYDLGNFVDKHPGGQHYIELTRGTDITMLVKTYHPMMDTTDIAKKIEKMKVTEVPGYNSQETPLFDELREAVRAYIKYNGSKGSDHLLWSLFFVTWAWGLVYYGLNYVHSGDLWDGIALGLCMWLVCADSAHSGSHSSIMRSPKDNLIITRSLGSFFSTSSQWLRQHVVSHHIYTNKNSDPDIWHHPGAALPWRVSENTPWRRSFSRWKFGLALTGWMTQIVPNVYYTIEMLLRQRYPPSNAPVVWCRDEYKRTVFELAVTLCCMFWIMLRHGVLSSLVPSAVCGCLYYAFSQVSHINLPVDYPNSSEWAVDQICNCSGDWGCDSSISSFFSIGLNNQGIHHLFPTVHHSHHTKLMRAFKPIMSKFGVYHGQVERSFSESLAGHLKRLDELNRWREPVILHAKPMPLGSDSDDEVPPDD